ncbi:MAG: hypothetical protein JW902_09110, partial [Syntrophaceae bacterium]|nr:hypothetical protein [Syntrophaceae bacterium]
YENQRPTWEKLRAAHQKFKLNHLELDRDMNASAALKRMEEILAAPAPYGMLYEAEGLIRTVGEVNEALIRKGREKVSVKIPALIEEIKQELDAVSAEGDLYAECLNPLQRLRDQALKQESIAHLNQAEQEAQKAFDRAMEKIEKFVSKPPVKPGTSGEAPAVKPPVAIKPRCIVNAAELAGSAYLETPDDIEKFLRELRQRLEEAIKTGKRVQIR